jgi:uncharacterized protein YozE (UPF0346 family)
MLKLMVEKEWYKRKKDVKLVMIEKWFSKTRTETEFANETSNFEQLITFLELSAKYMHNNFNFFSTLRYFFQLEKKVSKRFPELCGDILGHYLPFSSHFLSS